MLNGRISMLFGENSFCDSVSLFPIDVFIALSFQTLLPKIIWSLSSQTFVLHKYISRIGRWWANWLHLYSPATGDCTTASSWSKAQHAFDQSCSLNSKLPIHNAVQKRIDYTMKIQQSSEHDHHPTMCFTPIFQVSKVQP